LAEEFRIFEVRVGELGNASKGVFFAGKRR